MDILCYSVKHTEYLYIHFTLIDSFVESSILVAFSLNISNRGIISILVVLYLKIRMSQCSRSVSYGPAILKTK